MCLKNWIRLRQLFRQFVHLVCVFAEEKQKAIEIWSTSTAWLVLVVWWMVLCVHRMKQMRTCDSCDNKRNGFDANWMEKWYSNGAQSNSIWQFLVESTNKKVTPNRCEFHVAQRRDKFTITAIAFSATATRVRKEDVQRGPFHLESHVHSWWMSSQ